MYCMCCALRVEVCVLHVLCTEGRGVLLHVLCTDRRGVCTACAVH